MRSWRSVVFLFSLALLLCRTPASANNVTITNVSLAPLGNGLAQIEFDLSWENSWRDSTNFDACWLFVKYSLDGGTRWRHVTLATSGTNPASFSPGTNTDLQVVVPADKKGAFIQRTSAGEGTAASDDVRLVWNFAADGVSSNAQAQIRVMGLEMVFIPEGSFYCGGNTNSSLTSYLHMLPVTYINTSDMSQTNTSGLGTIASPYVGSPLCGRPGNVLGTFSNGYPNGYNAYYIMKYELSEGMYVDFLNTLTREQALSRYPNMAGILARSTITGSFSELGGSFSSSAPNRAMVFYYWYDCHFDTTAVVDWSGLRPATELEFVKAGRGPGLPVDLEYAWGTTNRYLYSNVVNDATALEAPSTNYPNANLNMLSCVPAGPIRNGAFATNGSDRIKAGAGYYGVMELSGNVIDRVLPTGGQKASGASVDMTAICPAYNGAHGDGELNSFGMTDMAGLPFSGAYTFAACGGGWGTAALECSLASRRTWSYLYNSGNGGIRAARTAP